MVKFGLRMEYLIIVSRMTNKPCIKMSMIVFCFRDMRPYQFLSTRKRETTHDSATGMYEIIGWVMRSAVCNAHDNDNCGGLLSFVKF